MQGDKKDNSVKLITLSFGTAIIMEKDELQHQWKGVEQLLLERFGKIPDLDGILFLIGINELGGNPTHQFTKEQKQDLMHVGVCTLLSQKGYYALQGRDNDGWPHFAAMETVPAKGVLEQEHLLKECILLYFNQ